MSFFCHQKEQWLQQFGDYLYVYGLFDDIKRCKLDENFASSFRVFLKEHVKSDDEDIDIDKEIAKIDKSKHPVDVNQENETLGNKRSKSSNPGGDIEKVGTVKKRLKFP